MILILAFTAAALIAPAQATYDNMNDEDFALFVQKHDNLRVEYGESAGKGCVSGGVGAAPAGFQALCIGCALGAAGNVAADIVFPERKDR